MNKNRIEIVVYFKCALLSWVIFLYVLLDDRILEYDVDELLFEEKSEFQKVQIFHTKSFGNILVLDDLQSK